MLWAAYLWTFWIALPFIVLFAFVAGGETEKRAAALIFVAAIASKAAEHVGPMSFHEVELDVAAVDFLFLAGLLWLTFRSPRWWLICIASFHLVAVLGHLAKLLNPDLSRMSYAVMQSLSAYPMEILLLIATALHWRARRR